MVVDSILAGHLSDLILFGVTITSKSVSQDEYGLVMNSYDHEKISSVIFCVIT